MYSSPFFQTCAKRRVSSLSCICCLVYFSCEIINIEHIMMMSDDNCRTVVSPSALILLMELLALMRSEGESRRTRSGQEKEDKLPFPLPDSTSVPSSSSSSSSSSTTTTIQFCSTSKRMLSALQYGDLCTSSPKKFEELTKRDICGQ